MAHSCLLLPYKDMADLPFPLDSAPSMHMSDVSVSFVPTPRIFWLVLTRYSVVVVLSKTPDLFVKLRDYI